MKKFLLGFLLLATVAQAQQTPIMGASIVPEYSSNSGGGAVDSVNGQTGVVDLNAGDIDPVTDRNYVTDSELSAIGTALQAVAHDGTLDGDGTVGNPLTVVGGGGSGITYGGAVTTGHNNEALYIDSAGNLASDVQFTRDATQETIIAQTQGSQTAQFRSTTMFAGMGVPFIGVQRGDGGGSSFFGAVDLSGVGGSAYSAGGLASDNGTSDSTSLFYSPTSFSVTSKDATNFGGSLKTTGGQSGQSTVYITDGGSAYGGIAVEGDGTGGMAIRFVDNLTSAYNWTAPTNAPAAGNVITAISDSQTTWAAPASSPPRPLFNESGTSHIFTDAGFAGVAMQNPAARTVQLPPVAGLADGTTISVKDWAYTASIANIVVSPDGGAGETIDGQPTYTISSNGASALFTYNISLNAWVVQ